jgi:hypothetical protein
MKIEILNRWTNACLWSGEIEEQGNASRNLGAAVKTALAVGANLDGANLRGANLCGANLGDANLGDANLFGADLCGADLRDANLGDANLDGANLCGADLRGANLRGANLDGANLSGANLRGANLRGANLCGADLRGKKISALCVFSGLYEYQIWAYVLEDGSPWVRMGCQNRSVAEWDVLTIRESRTSEYPNDGSSRSERRARAFEFARGEALSMAHEVANQKDEK